MDTTEVIIVTDNTPLINAKDLCLVDNNGLNERQLAQILKKTPAKYLRTRPAKGGGTWEYVTGGYVKKCLNLLFGFDWDFEILDEKIFHGEAIVKGKLTCRSNGKTISKMQFGNKDIIYRKQNAEDISKGLDRVPLSIGNDLKSAATDCLKKCASEIGIAADIYNKEEFREVLVGTDKDFDSIHAEIVKLFNEKQDLIPKEDIEHIERIIENKEQLSYNKVLKSLKNYK
jgi:hypothetical protein